METETTAMATAVEKFDLFAQNVDLSGLSAVEKFDAFGSYLLRERELDERLMRDLHARSVDAANGQPGQPDLLGALVDLLVESTYDELRSA